MYRDSQHTFAETIERLERELAEMRAVHAPPRPRERTLWVVTALSLVAAVLAVAACGAAHTRAGYYQQRFDAAAARLDMKTQDLNTCEKLVDDHNLADQQARLEWAREQMQASERAAQAALDSATKAGSLD